MASQLLAFIREQLSRAMRSRTTPPGPPAPARHHGLALAGHRIQPLEPRLLLAFESDIVANDVTGVAATYDVGQRITARADFYNGGNIGTGAFRIRFYLATASDSTVVFIQEREVLNLSPCCPSNAIIGVPGWQIPYDNNTIRSGRYRITAHLDYFHEVAETSDTNNVAYSPFFDIRHPDLRTALVTGVESSYARGSAVHVTATILNDGPARAWGSLADPYRIAFYLGADQSEPPSVSSMTLLKTGLIRETSTMARPPPTSSSIRYHPRRSPAGTGSGSKWIPTTSASRSTRTTTGGILWPSAWSART